MEKEIFILVGFLEIVMAIFMQWQVYVASNITTFKFQSWILGIFLLAFGFIDKDVPMVILALLTIITRAIFIPKYLLNTINKYLFRARENKHRIGTSLSVLVSVLLAIFSYILSIVILSNVGSPLISIPLTLMLQGAFLIVSRSNAYAQMIGYLVMENAMFLMGFIFTSLPFIVEAGVIMDILGIVMVGGILMKIRDEDIKQEEELLG